MYNRIIKSSLFLLLHFLPASMLRAQEAPPVFDELFQTSDDDDMASDSDGAPDQGSIPVDGGLTLLLAAGAAYGVGRVRGRGK